MTKPAQRYGPGSPVGPNRITAEVPNRIPAPASAVAFAPRRCGSPRTPVAASVCRSGSALAT